MTLTIDVALEAVSVILKFEKCVDRFKVVLRQNFNVRIYTDVEVEEKNAENLEIARFASGRRSNNMVLSPVMILVDASSKLSFYLGWLL